MTDVKRLPRPFSLHIWLSAAHAEWLLRLADEAKQPPSTVAASILAAVLDDDAAAHGEPITLPPLGDWLSDGDAS